MTYADRVMAEMASERASLGLLEGKPMPLDARDRVLNRMCALFIAEAVAGLPKAKRKPKVSDMTDEDWLASLQSDPAFSGVNIPAEIARCGAWYRQNVSKTGQPSRRRIVNWLLKSERVVSLKAMGAQHATGLKPPPPAGPDGWHSWLGVELSTLSDEAPGYGQLKTAHNLRNFSLMPQSWQTRCRSQLVAGKAQTA